MHNFCGTAFVCDGSVLITMRRRALHNSQHRLLCGTNAQRAHNSAFREHFERSEECNGLAQRRYAKALTMSSHNYAILCNMTLLRFFLEPAGDGPLPWGGGVDTGGGMDTGEGGKVRHKLCIATKPMPRHRTSVAESSVFESSCLEVAFLHHATPPKGFVGND